MKDRHCSTVVEHSARHHEVVVSNPAGFRDFLPLLSFPFHHDKVLNQVPRGGSSLQNDEKLSIKPSCAARGEAGL